MLSLQLEEFMIELKEGSIKNVGAPNKAATAKLYDVEEAEVRTFGDERLKFSFADAEGNQVDVALSPETAEAIAEAVPDELEALAEL
ncbi:hypothetical protein L593_02540 [Salinarchaeum sp. Harcht-Bsk1]|uniref:hypothetical protein n=1 Tax=Salinarchaeum sp. Harcht-Bsk1 TaxID=1333523 RepID=UPI00034241D1|nr:hypothetical protein [Salinarchaeum sp. Harcht-Bsk1]AGN00459.1 hypothetical protein L593_02540 [Salinarchaeum sp. Harcht-Bsk1]